MASIDGPDILFDMLPGLTRAVAAGGGVSVGLEAFPSKRSATLIPSHPSFSVLIQLFQQDSGKYSFRHPLYNQRAQRIH